MTSKDFRPLIWTTVILALIPIFFYLYKFGSFTFSEDKAEWGTFGDYVGGILNPLISILTLGVTVYIAYSINEYEMRRDREMKYEVDVKSYMELYQFFITPEFRETRVIAWYVLKKAIENPTYRDFIVKENYVSRYIDRMPRDKVYNTFKDFLYIADHPLDAQPVDKKDFLKQEALGRNKVDVLINFFQFVAIKNVPVYYYQICDFYYDTWRPVLYWYANQLEIEFNKFENNQKYNNPPTLRAALAKLDKNYYNPAIMNVDFDQQLSQHPIIEYMRTNSQTW